MQIGLELEECCLSYVDTDLYVLFSLSLKCTFCFLQVWQNRCQETRGVKNEMKVTRFLRLGGVSLDSLKFLPERSSACAFSSHSQRSLVTLAAKQVEATQLSRGDSLFLGLLKKTSISNPTPWPKHFSNSSLVRGIVSRGHQKSRRCLWHSQWPNSWNAGLFYSTKLNKMANVSAILKNQSALEVTKPARKKAPRISELGKVRT